MNCGLARACSLALEIHRYRNDNSPSGAPLSLLEQVDSECRFQVVCNGCLSDCPESTDDISVDDPEAVPHCAALPEGVNEKGDGETVESLELKTGYYRVSNKSRDILECYRDEACEGGADVSAYCATGYTGACEVFSWLHE